MRKYRVIFLALITMTISALIVVAFLGINGSFFNGKHIENGNTDNDTDIINLPIYEKGEGLVFNLKDDDTYEVMAVIDANTSNVIIPETFKGKMITSIDHFAFREMQSLQSIVIPNSITQIEFSAFDGCTNLSEVHIDDLASWCNIEFMDKKSNPLYNNGKLYVKNELASDLIISSNIEIINKYAFAFCSSITSLTLEKGVKEIGSEAFYHCTNLKDVSISDSVMAIKASAFRFCNGLEKVNVDNLVKWCNIDFYDEYSNPLFYSDGLFVNNSLVNNLIIPKEITYIKQYAFAGCESIERVLLHDNVLVIGNGTFGWCENLVDIDFVSKNSKLISIGDECFSQCVSLTSIILPNNVSQIGNLAFNGCSNLSQVHLGKNIKFVGSLAFAYSNIEVVNFAGTMNAFLTATKRTNNLEIPWDEGMKYNYVVKCTDGELTKVDFK